MVKLCETIAKKIIMQFSDNIELHTVKNIATISKAVAVVYVCAVGII